MQFMQLIKGQTNETVDIFQNEAMKAFDEFQIVLEKLNIRYKQMINLVPEEDLRKFSKMGYKQEVQWCLDILESLKRLERCSDKETKRVKQIVEKRSKG